MNCPLCGGVVKEAAQWCGGLIWCRCRDCGADWFTDDPEDVECDEHEPDLYCDEEDCDE